VTRGVDRGEMKSHKHSALEQSARQRFERDAESYEIVALCVAFYFHDLHAPRLVLHIPVTTPRV
jgi:hypothetical protein